MPNITIRSSISIYDKRSSKMARPRQNGITPCIITKISSKSKRATQRMKIIGKAKTTCRTT